MKHHNPWNGAAYYQEPTAHTTEENILFCGRDREINELLQLVTSNIFVTLYGKSGLGKTSLLMAGLFPRLRSARYLPVYLRLGDKPVDDLSQFVIDCVEKTVKDEKGTVVSLTVLDGDGNDKPVAGDVADSTTDSFLWAYFANHSFRCQDGRTVFPVLVLDQFEEFFRSNEQQTAVLMRQISYMTDGLHELSEQILSNGFRYVYSYNFRFVAAIREDELYRLEDCIDNNFLNHLKTNRMRLRGLSRTGAGEVIRIPGRDCISQIDLEQVTRDIIDNAPNGDGTVNTLLLSVICTNLYDSLNERQLINRTMTRSLDYTIEAFYHQQVGCLPVRERNYIEDSLVDGTRRRPVSIKEFTTNAPNALEKAPALFHKFALSGGNDLHVELVHDRLAEVVGNLKRQKRINSDTILIRSLIAMLVIIMAGLAIYNGLGTDDKTKVTTAYTEVRDHHLSTTDTLWLNDPEKTEHNGMVEELDIEDKSEYTVTDCPYLTTIDLTKVGTDTLQLTLNNLPLLNTIVMPARLPMLKINISKCPRLTLLLNTGLGHMEVQADQLSVRMDDGVERYVRKDQVLWDVEERRIVYYHFPNDKPTSVRCSFPDQVAEQSVTYCGVEFQNQNQQTADSRSSHSYFMDHTSTTIAPQNFEPSLKQIHLPDSVDGLPDRMCYQFHRLDSVMMPHYVRVIGESAFEGCNQLCSVRLPEGLVSIMSYAFKNCKQLRYIEIPSTVQFIHEEAFAECDSLQTVVIHSDSVYLGPRAFGFNPSLRKVEWTGLVSRSYDFFNNPFFGCRQLRLLEDDVSVPPEANAVVDGVAFYADGTVYADTYPAELHMPLNYVQRCLIFVGDVSTITDIYVPYPHPTIGVSAYGVSHTLSIDLPDEVKGNITLHVPYGCRRYYEVQPGFTAFRQIDESSLVDTYLQFFMSRLRSLWDNMTSSWYVHVPLFLLFIFAGWFVMRFRHRPDKWWRLLPGALLYAVLVSLSSVAFYWANQLIDGASPNQAGVTGGILAFLLITLAFDYREIKEWTNRRFSHWPSLPELVRKGIEKFSEWLIGKCRRYWLWLLVVLTLIAVAYGGVVYYQRTHDIHLAISQGDYQRALELKADELISRDSIYSDEAAELRRLVIMSGVQPRFNLIQTLHNYRFVGSTENTHFYYKEGNTVTLWTESGQCYQRTIANPFGGDVFFNVSPDDKFLSLYDEGHNKSVLYDLTKSGEAPLIMDGRLYQTFINQNLLFTRQGDSLFVYDKQGHHLNVPYANFTSWSVSDNAIVEDVPHRLFSHVGERIVTHSFPSGEMIGVIGHRYLLWKDGLSDTQDFYDIENDFTLCTSLDIYVDDYNYGQQFFLKTNGNTFSVRDVEGKRSWYIQGIRLFVNRYIICYGDDKGLHILDTRKNHDQADVLLSQQVPALSRLSSSGFSMTADRYLIICDYTYRKTYIFDTNRQCQLMATLDGSLPDGQDPGLNLSMRGTDHLWLQQGDSLQFYRFADDKLFRGSRLSLDIAREGKWTEGFIIIKSDNGSLLYSMDDDALPIVIHRPLDSNTYLAGNTMLLPAGEQLHIYQYDSLEDLIDRSSLQQSVKQRLKTIIVLSSFSNSTKQ